MVFITLGVGCASTDKVQLKKNDRIIFLGDSITWYAGGPTGYVTVVGEVLHKTYLDLNLEVIRSGISGNKVADLQRRLDRDVVGKKPTIVVIYIGINNCWDWVPVTATPAKAAYEAGLRDVIARIRAGARPILCTPTVIGEKTDGTNKYDAALDECSNVGRKVAKETGTQLIDLRKEFVTYLKRNNTMNREQHVLTLDTVHLNDTGHGLVAARMLEGLGVPRAIAYRRLISEPVIIPRQTPRRFVDRAQCELTHIMAPDGQIRYTLDGSEPTKSSPRYIRPIAIEQTTTVRARFFHKYGQSPVAAETFTKVEPVSWNGHDLYPGVTYRYYEGTWDGWPDFRTMTPLETGVASNFMLLPQKPADFFAFEFIGCLRVPADGEYTFFLNSDDGSKLFIDGREVADKAVQGGAGTVKLTAGTHPIRVLYYEWKGVERLEVQYQGPGIARQAIPDSELFHEIVPREAVAPYANGRITIDGKLDEAAWNKAEWSDAFVDICGSQMPRPQYETRVKMLWDDKYLYIAARIEEPHVWATKVNRNSRIYDDNDFEVFIDPDGDGRNYYEFEMNARNTVWNLLLFKPYSSGGGGIIPYDLKGQITAVHVDGTLNDPSDVDKGWTVEIAFPWSSLKEYAKCASPPKSGDRWRINFSRVEWGYSVVNGTYRREAHPTGGGSHPEANWVWSPQGETNMHKPEMWGYVRFAKP